MQNLDFVFEEKDINLGGDYSGRGRIPMRGGKGDKRG
jgi:hypothetical protein